MSLTRVLLKQTQCLLALRKKKKFLTRSSSRRRNNRRRSSSEEETTEEEVVSEEEVVAEYDIEEDVNALLAGEELSEEFQEKARTIFEAAINSKVATIKEGLEKEYEEKFVSELAEAIVETKEELTTRVDSYLEYVAE